MLTGRISLVPVDLDHYCGYWYSEQGGCVLTVNRLYSTWCARTRLWRPQLRLCHLHAHQALTGEPILAGTHADREREMLELAA